jgi:hypothetical protein
VDGEVEVPFAPVGSSMSFQPGGFKISSVEFLAEGLEGLSTLGDSLLTGFFFGCEAGWISSGTLHRNP